jgi:FAD/FMN-containing dehydrogenase
MDSVSTTARQLRDIVGTDHVLDDGESRAYYASDALGDARSRDMPRAALPIAVVMPGTTAEVAAIARCAAREGLHMVPRGAGTGLMGGGRSTPNAIVLDMSRMNRVREIDPLDESAWIEAGCVLEAADSRVREHGLMLGHDPWTFGVATVGGALSTNGLGFLGGKYGGIGQQVLAVEAVLADGSVLRTRAPQPHSTGIDLARLFVGGEGEYGIVTAAALRLFHVPEVRELRGWRFDGFTAGFEALIAMRRSGVSPTVLDYGERFDAEDRRSTLYLGYDGFRDEVEAYLSRAADVSASRGGAAIDQSEVRDFWDTRHAIAEGFALARRERGVTAPRAQARDGLFDYVHVALPVSAVLEYRHRSVAVAAAHRVSVVEAGLWVTPGLFSLVLARCGGAGPTDRAAMAGTIDDCLRLAQDMGGAMEYCHGVGVQLAHIAELEHGAGLAVMRAVKRALDPGFLLNPGKSGL